MLILLQKQLKFLINNIDIFNKLSYTKYGIIDGDKYEMFNVNK